jgi:group I intron endonuclease
MPIFRYCMRMTKTCGIYLITCTKPSGVNIYYVGQSNHCERRRLEHFGSLRRGTHYNERMQRAYTKHGESCFLFEVMEKCEVTELNEKEHVWLSLLAGKEISFNVAFFPDSPMRGLRQSDEAKTRISAKNTGKRHSEETKRLISLIQTGKKRGPATEERKRKIGDAQMGEKNHSFGKKGFSHHRSKAVVATSIETSEKRIFGSCFEAARSGFSQPSISGVCNGKWKTHRGHTWRFATEQEVIEHMNIMMQERLQSPP